MTILILSRFIEANYTFLGSNRDSCFERNCIDIHVCCIFLVNVAFLGIRKE